MFFFTKFLIEQTPSEHPLAYYHSPMILYKLMVSAETELYKKTETYL